MPRQAISAFLFAALLAAATADAGEPSVLAPFRFQGADDPLTALDDERARAYRTQVQNQLRTLDQDAARGRLKGSDERLLLDARSELQRVNRVIQQPVPIDLGIAGGSTLPSLRSAGLP